MNEVTDAYEAFSEELATLCNKHGENGVSDVEIVGALRLVSAMIEVKSNDGVLKHITVVEVEECEEDLDSGDAWKRG